MQTGKQLTKVNLWNKDNCLFIHKTNLGLVVESVKESLIKRDAVTFFHIKIFRKGAVEFITLMLLKLFQRSVSGLFSLDVVVFLTQASHLVDQNISYKKV